MPSSAFPGGAYHLSSPAGNHDIKINYDKVLNERFLRTCVEEKVILEFWQCVI